MQHSKSLPKLMQISFSKSRRIPGASCFEIITVFITGVPKDTPPILVWLPFG